MKAELQELLRAALARAKDSGAFPVEELPEIRIEEPRETGYGDLATNIALVTAKAARRSPRELAEALVAAIDDPDGIIEKVEVAGPGFINFTFSNAAWQRRLAAILAEGENYGSPDLGKGRRVQVEFVSANPTGPLHIGHGRGAAVGDALARVLEAAGYDVKREYYVNDAGVQINTLGRSVRARYLQLAGVDTPFPDDGYPGDYVTESARGIFERDGRKWVDVDVDEAVVALGRIVADEQLAGIRTDLHAFGVSFDGFSSERALCEAGAVEHALERLRERGCVYDADGAVWFRSSDFGDDKDRPLIKSDGQLTYFAADIAYHLKKLEAGFDTIIDVWGADHHGYVPRVRSSIQALGHDPARFAVLLVQMVNLTRDGEPVRMGKRTGTFITLKEVVDEVGADLARFFFLMRKSDAHLDFDLELARRQSAENPVFYVQYAYTRIAGIFRQATEKGIVEPSADAAAVTALQTEEEISLIRMLDSFPDVVEAAADTLEPHRIVFYVQKLAGEFHRFYARHRCVTEDAELTAARLLLVRAVQMVIGRGLGLVGVNAPERM